LNGCRRARETCCGLAQVGRIPIAQGAQASAASYPKDGTTPTLGTAVCTNAATTPNADGTDDCVLPITFAPTVSGPDNATLTVTAGTTLSPPVYTDVTLWTDLQPVTHAELHHDSGNISLAAMIGWPFTLAGLLGLLRFRRRRAGLSGLVLVALAMVLAGASLALNGCAGPGAYTPNFTTAGTYPITITVTGPNVSQYTVIDFTVTSPGITGQQ